MSVVLCAGLVPAGATARAELPGVRATQVLYTLTVTFAGEEDVREQTTKPYDWQPGLDPTVKVHLPKGFLTGEAHRRTVFDATSVRPFAIARATSAAGTVYRFQAAVAGTLDHTGSGASIGYDGCRSPWTEKSTVKGVSGSVSVPGWHVSPAALFIDIDPTRWRDAVVQTHPAACGAEQGSTNLVETLLPQHARWTGSIGVVETTAFALGKHFGDAFRVQYRLSQKRVTAKGYGGIPPAIQAVHRRSYVWTLTFTPVKEQTKTERWQVDVRGRDRSSWGRTAAGPGAGVWVNWVHRTVLEIENGKVTSATGRAIVERVDPFSDPPGVFDVGYRTKTRRAYPLQKAVLRGKKLELNLYDKRDRNFYRVDLSFRLVGTAALDRLKAAGVPDAEVVYKSLAGRTIGPWADSVDVPSRLRLVIKLALGPPQRREPDAYNPRLPCKLFGSSASVCFLTRGGEEITVRKLT